MTMQIDAPVLAPETYLALERATEVKHEYGNGAMIPMTGAGRWHSLIIGAICTALHHQLRRRPHYQRRANGEWLFAEFKRLDQAVSIQSIGCTIALADVYEKVTGLAAAEFETNGTH